MESNKGSNLSLELILKVHTQLTKATMGMDATKFRRHGEAHVWMGSRWMDVWHAMAEPPTLPLSG